MRISAVVPVYAETEALRRVVAGLVEAADRWLYEVLIVLAPPAPDETRRICARLAGDLAQVRVLEQARFPGLGWAVRQGINEAKGSHILLVDGDGEMDTATVPDLVRALQATGADLAVASRWMAGGRVIGYPRAKYPLTLGFQYAFRPFYRTRIHDLSLGYKLGRAEVLQKIAWRGRFHEIACETTLRPLHLGYQVVEVPTVWRRRGAGSSSNPFRRNFRYVAMAIWILLEQRPRR